MWLPDFIAYNKKDTKHLKGVVSLMKDLIIIGAGPAGLSASVYAVRAGLDIEIFESNYVPGGQVLTTYEVDNYLGMPGFNGFDMGVKFKEHAEKMGVTINTASVSGLEKSKDSFIVQCGDKSYESRMVLVATGAINRKLGLQSETRLQGKGISYCATCDGAFYKAKTTAVVGGSYTAVEDAIYLSAICEKVYLIHHRDKLRAGAYLEKKLFDCKNVEILWNQNVIDILGEEKVDGLKLQSTDGKESQLSVFGVFIAVGTTPQTDLIKDMVELDAHGYVVAGEGCESSMSGLFVAGDLRTKPLRQITTAVSDGASAVTTIRHKLYGY